MKFKITFVFAISLCQSLASDYVLWYNTPAKAGMKEPLPIGNGRVAGLIYGEPARERINVNEISLWTGDSNDVGDYQTLGNLTIELSGHQHNNYRRDLDIGDSIATVQYQSNGVHYKREYLATHLEEVLVAHLTADKSGSYTGHISLDDSHGVQGHVDGDTITVKGQLKNGLQYEWQVHVQHTGGNVHAQGSTIQFNSVDSLTLIVGAGTNYHMDSTKNFRDGQPDTRVSPKVKSASQKSYDSLRSAHINDYHSLFNRVELDLGQSSDQQKSKPTNERKSEAVHQFDPDLEELIFQYGRYLMISSSRGFLPGNLQGIWNDINNPPWEADYHTNINVQMNYWPAEVTNLGELHVPLFNLIRGQLPIWRKYTRQSNELQIAPGKHSSKGVAVGRSHNIYGAMSMAGNMNQDRANSAWYGQHFWWHFVFGQDRAFLKDIAYPYLKEVADFWDEQLKEHNGKLVVPDSWSPEHGPIEDGVSYSQEIVWELLTAYVKAADILVVDKEFRDRMAQKRDRLLWPKIGSFGQVLEWMSEKPGEADDHHRHTSHLFGVFPGHMITPDTQPALSKAASVSLAHRGIAPNSDITEWAFAWRVNIYARLRDGQNAHHLVQQFLDNRNSCPNLFGDLSVMQIDGNFGITSGIAEMLIQSHNDNIEVLPALPKSWNSGHVKGLRARGGYEVDIHWSNGSLIDVVIKSKAGNAVKVKYGNTEKHIPLSVGQTVKLNHSLGRIN